MSSIRIFQVMTWVIGRLDKRRDYGLIEGGTHSLSDKGRLIYADLENAGFSPTDDEVKVVLEALGSDMETFDELLRLIRATDKQVEAVAAEWN